MAGTVVLGLCIQSALGLSGIFALKAALLFPLLFALVGPSLKDHDGRIGPASYITLFRAGLSGLVFAFIGEPTAESLSVALWFFAGVAFVLDSVDGFVARVSRTVSEFGGRLDMELDGLTVLGLGGLLVHLDQAGEWALIAGLLRYAWIAAEWSFEWMRRPLFPTNWRRYLCGVQLTTAIFALLPWSQSWLPVALVAIGLLGLLFSFGRDFVWLLARRAEPATLGAPSTVP